MYVGRRGTLHVATAAHGNLCSDLRHGKVDVRISGEHSNSCSPLPSHFGQSTI